MINVLSNILLFFCITLLYPTTWAHRILATGFHLYHQHGSRYSLYHDLDLVRVYPVLHQRIRCLTSHADHCTHEPALSSVQKRCHSAAKHIYAFTAIFIPLGSILLAHYIARTLSWRSLVAAIVLLLINVSVISLYDRMIHLMQERHTALLIESKTKPISNSCNSCRRARCGCGFLRHDMKNHLFQIKHFLETNDMEGMYTYINDLEDNLDLTQSITYTQHEAINSILNYKLLPLRTDGVALEVDVQLPDQLTYPILI